MKRILTIILFISLFNISASAQDYNNGIGVKFGSSNGVSFKTFLSSNGALEIVAGSKWRGIHALALYEIHAQAFDVPGLYWYYGFGGHLGFWDRKYSPFYKDDEGAFTAFGIDGVLGMEYKIEAIPITISLDVVPAFNLVGYTGLYIDGGLGIRYVF